MMNKRIPIILAAAFALSACVGNAPAPETNPAAAEGRSDTTASDMTDSDFLQETSASLGNHRLNTPDSKFHLDEASPASDPSNDKAPPSASERNQTPLDPYTTFPAMVQAIFEYAASLHKQGKTDSASAYLERFRIIKPLWATWEARADSMLNEFGKKRAELAKRYEPLVLEIQNMNRAQAAYSMVSQTVDSLIALAPGDSLTAWAFTQKQIAYRNTLKKAQKEYAEILSLADDKAQFAEAQKKAKTFQMRYRDFEDTLHIQSLIGHIEGLADATDPTAAKYWEKNDPAQALAKVDTLIGNEKFKEAKELLNKLKASALRAQALQKYQLLADAYCNKQRKATSQIFAKAQNQKDAEKKRKLLRDAISPLDKCLTEYPENSQKKKVQENKQFLEKELSK